MNNRSFISTLICLTLLQAVVEPLAICQDAAVEQAAEYYRNKEENQPALHQPAFLRGQIEIDRNQLNDSLLNLRQKLGSMITLVADGPQSELPETDDESTVNGKLDELRDELRCSRAKLNSAFEETQSQIYTILRDQARSRMLQNSLPSAVRFPLDNQPRQTPVNTADDSSDQADAAQSDSKQRDQTSNQSDQTFDSGPILLTATPVDQMALADNVFVVGDIQTAKRIYADLLTKKISAADQRWINFQLAACHRRLHEYDEAQRLLRELSNSGSSDFPIPQARWWLAAIEKRIKSERDLTSIDTSLSAAKQEVSK